MADNDRVIMQAQLKQLRAATNIVLMIVPEDVLFRFRVDEKWLPRVACVYHISSVPRTVSDDVLKILNDSILEYGKGNKGIIETRIGIIFRNENSTLQEFYFEDWGGKRDVSGFSGEYRLLALADLPSRLRALITHRDVVLTQSRNSTCPHS